MRPLARYSLRMTGMGQASPVPTWFAMSALANRRSFPAWKADIASVTHRSAAAQSPSAATVVGSTDMTLGRKAAAHAIRRSRRLLVDVDIDAASEDDFTSFRHRR